MSFLPYEIYKSTEHDWLGTIPTSWRTQKFRHLFKESSEKIEGEVFGEMLSVSGYRGIERKEYDDENRRRSDEDLVGYRVVRKGQLVVNTMWLNYAGLGFSELGGHVSPAYRAYWPKSDEHSKYLHYLLRSEHYVKGYTRLLTGIRPNSLQMSRDNMMGFPVVLPPKAEQIAISTFLDRETAKIDALISEQQRLIELLQEKRQAVISHAVTKGLNPNAPMKDSGVEWLGEVPEHWEVKQVRHIVKSLSQGSSPSCLQEPAGDEEYGVLKVGCVNEVAFLPTENKKLPPETEPDLASLIEPGVVLISRGNTKELVGLAALATKTSQRLLASDLIFMLRTWPRKIHPQFLVMALRSQNTRAQIEPRTVGTSPSMQKINQSTVKELLIVVPPLAEQQAIMGALNERNGCSEKWIHDSRLAVQLLQERRSALISAAVTGQIDVRGLVKAEAGEQ